jgi:hypothetical protein
LERQKANDKVKVAEDMMRSFPGFRKLLFFAFILCLPAVLVARGFAQTFGTGSKQPLRVLYIGGDAGVLGGPGPERAADFKNFLEANFSEVKVVRGADFQLEMASGFDVIVKDAPIKGVLPITFRKPMVLIGSNGLAGIDRTGTKIKLLCECLREKLYDTKTDHAIFQGPLPVTPTIVQEKNPYTGEVTGMWNVHEKVADPGLVTAIEQFLDADDSEIISGGINLKGDHGVALVREANLFLWGPIGRPQLMNEEARRVLVNTIMYMKRFDGAKQTVWRGLSGRQELQMVLATKDMHKMLSPERVYQSFLPELVTKYGPEIEKYRSFYTPNLPYVRQSHGAVWFDVDQDAKSLGIANNDPRLLEKCVHMLQQPAQAAEALKLLQRYTGLSLSSASEWQSWLGENKDKLYFSDSYDYRFFAGPAGPAPTQKGIQTAIKFMNMDEPNDVAPVSVGTAVATYFHSKDGNFSKKGALITLIVRLNIADGWHLYAKVPQDVPYQPVTIENELPEQSHWNGDWQRPTSFPGDVPGLTEYHGDAVFTRQFYPTAAVSKTTIRGTIHFQACNEEKCLPAVNAPLEIPLTVYEN